METKKHKWYRWEQIVTDRYNTNWFTILQKNYTIRWGEIDIIATKEDEIIFIEVKVIDSIDDIHWFLTKKKLHYLAKCSEHFVRAHSSYQDKQKRIDVVLVKNNNIYEHFTNVTLD